VSVLLDERRNLVGFSVVTRDLTERKQVEEVLRESEAKLRQQAQELEQQLIASGRLVSLGVVTASMAHEFNNPLGIIMGFAQELMSEATSDSRDYRALKIIDDETRRCQRLIQELLQFARPRSADLCPTDIKQSIEKTMSMVANRLYKEKIETNVVFDENLPLVSADPQQLEQVLVNLLLNAIDAMPKGGRITIEAGLEADTSSPAAVIIAVNDTGNGIEAGDLPKIFQPFFSAKKGKGIGLGLSICDRIIQNHGGKIAVQSTPGEGTSFKIHLPLESDANRSGAEILP
jgi:signal transduction histidine kinase